MKYSIFKTLSVTILLILLMWFVVQELIFDFSGLLLDWVLLKSRYMQLIVDALLSFIFMLTVYLFVYKINNIYSTFVVFISALFFLLEWAVNSGIFFNGFHPEVHPVWYEVNMGFNELLAAAFVSILLKARNKALDKDATVVAPIS